MAWFNRPLSLRFVVISACILASLWTALVWWLSQTEPGRTADAVRERLVHRSAEAALAVGRHQESLKVAFAAFAPLIADGRGAHGRALLGTLGVRQVCVIRPDSGQVVRTFPSGETACPDRLGLDVRTRIEALAEAGAPVITPAMRLGRDAPAPLVIVPAYNVIVVGELVPDRLAAPLRTGVEDLRLTLVDPEGGVLLANPGVASLSVRAGESAAIGRSGWVVRAEQVAPAGLLPGGIAPGALVVLLAGLGIAALTGVLAAARLERPLVRAADFARHLAVEGSPPDMPPMRGAPLGGALGEVEEYLVMLSDRLERPVPIPMAPPANAPQARPVAERRTAPRTLVVDSSIRQGQRLVRELSDLGVTAEHAGNGRRAEAMLEEAVEDGQPYGLMLVESTLPDMPGRALLRRVQSRYAGPQPLRIVGMAGAGAAGDLAPALQPGLSRPPTPEALAALFDGSATVASVRVEARTQAPPQEASPESDGQMEDVLVLDGDPDQRAPISRGLDALGLSAKFMTSVASDGDPLGEGALPAVVMLDLSMPGLNGLATIRRIAGQRGPDGARSTRVIAMVRRCSKVIEAACRSAGADAVLGKPIDHDALLAALAPPETASADRAIYEAV